MSAIWDALATVRDPELDEPITDLGFVGSAEVRDGRASVRLRLPTYFCAPNFAYLMVADARDAVRAVPGVVSVDVRLADHFAAELGLDCAPGSALLLDERGAPIPEEEAERRLRFARVVRVSIEGNAGFCRGLLRTRYAGAESSS